MVKPIDIFREHAESLDEESLRSRLTALYGPEGMERVITKPFELFNGKTPEEVVRDGRPEEKTNLEMHLVYGETRPWYLVGGQPEPTAEQ